MMTLHTHTLSLYIYICIHTDNTKSLLKFTFSKSIFRVASFSHRGRRREVYSYYNMGSDSETGERREKIASLSDHLSGSFVVDMQRVSHHVEKELAINSNSRIVRNLSRKGSIRANGETKFSGNERDTTTSPRASTLQGGGSSTPEKPTAVGAVAPTDHHSHHQIAITTSGGGGAATESKWDAAKRLSFRRTSVTWTTDPRRIFFFFATLSSMGTILLIYFTLSMGKLSAYDNASI